MLGSKICLLSRAEYTLENTDFASFEPAVNCYKDLIRAIVVLSDLQVFIRAVIQRLRFNPVRRKMRPYFRNMTE